MHGTLYSERLYIGQTKLKRLFKNRDGAHLLRMSYGNEWKKAVRLARKTDLPISDGKAVGTANRVRSRKHFEKESFSPVDFRKSNGVRAEPSLRLILRKSSM